MEHSGRSDRGPSRMLSKEFASSLVILKYEQSYRNDTSVVALVNPGTGHLRAIYKSDVSCKYQPRCLCNTDFEEIEDYSHDNSFKVRNSGNFNCHQGRVDLTPVQNAWMFFFHFYSNTCGVHNEQRKDVCSRVEVEV
jgi:hypothetical protein